MRKLLTLFLLVHCFAFSQEEEKKELRTIYVNNTQNVLIYFDSPIVQGISGHSNFKFAFNLESKNKFGILRGVPGVKSNLHIITDNGNVYSFHLEHKKSINNYNYFIPTSAAVGNVNNSEFKVNEKPSKQSTVAIDNEEKFVSKVEVRDVVEIDTEVTDYKNPQRDESEFLYNTDRQEYYRKFCSNMNNDKHNLKRVYTENEGLVIYLHDIVYNKNELYFKYRIKNNTGVDYKVNFARFAKLARKKSKNATSQAVDLDYVFSFNKFDIIPSGGHIDAIYVFKKFGINKNKKVVVEINELKGERNLKLEIDARYINNPR